MYNTLKDIIMLLASIVIVFVVVVGVTGGVQSEDEAEETIMVETVPATKEEEKIIAVVDESNPIKNPIVDPKKIEPIEEEIKAEPVIILEEPEVVEEPSISYSRKKLIESIPLDAETQWGMYEMCDKDKERYCTLMAIAWKESNFTNVIGDSGKSYGMFQINTSAQGSRLEELGLTKNDLLNPIACASVALDVLDDITEAYGWTGHCLLVAYNRGPGGARSLFNQGIYSTKYSINVTNKANEYMTEFTL